MLRPDPHRGRHALKQRLHILPTQRQNHSCRHSQEKLFRPRRRSPDPTQRLHTGIKITKSIQSTIMSKFQSTSVCHSITKQVKLPLTKTSRSKSSEKLFSLWTAITGVTMRQFLIREQISNTWPKCSRKL